MTTEQKNNLLQNLEDITLQANIAEQRTKLVKNKYEEIMYTLRLDQLQNPEKYANPESNKAEKS